MRLFCVHSFIALWRNFFSAMSRGRAQGHLQCLPQQVWFSLQKIGFFAVKVAGKTRFQKKIRCDFTENAVWVNRRLQKATLKKSNKGKER